jgi:hypothetical protein
LSEDREGYGLPTSPFAQHRVLVDSLERGLVEGFLRQHPIENLASYRRFLTELAIQTAVGRIPAETTSVLKELAGSIFTALETERANDQAARAIEEGALRTLLPPPTTGRRNLPIPEDILPSYSSHPVVLEAPDDDAADHRD